jgi:hypothetical protein
VIEVEEVERDDEQHISMTIGGEPVLGDDMGDFVVSVEIADSETVPLRVLPRGESWSFRSSGCGRT